MMSDLLLMTSLPLIKSDTNLMVILKKVVLKNAPSMLYGAFEKNLHLNTVTRQKKIRTIPGKGGAIYKY